MKRTTAIEYILMVAMLVVMVCMAQFAGCLDAQAQGLDASKERITPVNATTEKVEKDGKTSFRVYSVGNPRYYKNKKTGGRWLAIDVADLETVPSSDIGTVKRRSKGIVDVDLRDAAAKTDCVVFRREGAKIAFSMGAYSINGIGQSDAVAKPSKVTDYVESMGAFKVWSGKNRSRILFPATDATKIFRVSMYIDTPGLTMKEAGGQFSFYKGKKFVVGLALPVLIDTKMNVISGTQQAMKHSLVKVGKDRWLYTKESSDGFEKLDLPKNFYIDADIVYTNSYDFYCMRSGFSTWSQRDIYHGDPPNEGATALTYNTAFYDLGIISCFSTGNYYCYRSGFIFDLSGIPAGTATVVSVNIYGKTNWGSGVAIFKGVFADVPLAANWPLYTGLEFGRDSTWQINTYNTLSFNSTGLSYVSSLLGGSELCKITAMETEKDADGVAPIDCASNLNGLYFEDNNNDGTVPYIEITSTPTPTPSGGGGPFSGPGFGVWGFGSPPFGGVPFGGP